MDDILATNPVAPLPNRLSSLGQCLDNPVSTYLATKAEAKLAFHFNQPTALRKLISQYHVECLTRVTGTFSLWRRNPQELCLSVDCWLRGRSLLRGIFISTLLGWWCACRNCGRCPGLLA